MRVWEGPTDGRDAENIFDVIQARGFRNGPPDTSRINTKRFEYALLFNGARDTVLLGSMAEATKPQAAGEELLSWGFAPQPGHKRSASLYVESDDN